MYQWRSHGGGGGSFPPNQNPGYAPDMYELLYNDDKTNIHFLFIIH